MREWFPRRPKGAGIIPAKAWWVREWLPRRPKGVGMLPAPSSSPSDPPGCGFMARKAKKPFDSIQRQSDSNFSEPQSHEQFVAHDVNKAV